MFVVYFAILLKYFDRWIIKCNMTQRRWHSLFMTSPVSITGIWHRSIMRCVWRARNGFRIRETVDNGSQHFLLFSHVRNMSEYYFTYFFTCNYGLLNPPCFLNWASVISGMTLLTWKQMWFSAIVRCALKKSTKYEKSMEEITKQLCYLENIWFFIKS